MENLWLALWSINAFNLPFTECNHQKTQNISLFHSSIHSHYLVLITSYKAMLLIMSFFFADIYLYVIFVAIDILSPGFYHSINVALTLRASRKLHKKFLDTLLRTPMQFYDVTPLGR